MAKYREIEPGVFREEGFVPKDNSLSNEEYPRAIARLVYHCVDVVFWSLCNGEVLLHLAKRTQDPARDLWWVIGGSMRVGETLVETALRHLSFDTGLTVDPLRLCHLGQCQYLWAQGVAGLNNHVFADTFALRISDEEFSLVYRSLRAGEYDQEEGLRAYLRQDLIDENAHPGMIRIYDAINNHCFHLFSHNDDKWL